MADIYKMATLTVNAVSSGVGMRMLDEFLHKQEIDILLLQEVTHTEFDKIRGNMEHTIVGIHNGGTAMLTREQVTLPTSQGWPQEEAWLFSTEESGS
jgi:exonuclease III